MHAYPLRPRHSCDITCPARSGAAVSLSTMHSEMRRDLQAPEAKIETAIFNDWKYTFIEVARGVKVSVSDPKGNFMGYYPMPGKRSNGLSPNL